MQLSFPETCTREVITMKVMNIPLILFKIILFHFLFSPKCNFTAFRGRESKIEIETEREV